MCNVSVNRFSIGSDSGLSPIRHQAIILTIISTATNVFISCCIMKSDIQIDIDHIKTKALYHIFQKLTLAFALLYEEIGFTLHASWSLFAFDTIGEVAFCS